MNRKGICLKSSLARPVLLLLPLMLAVPSWAAECPEPAGASAALRRIGSEARLHFIQERLRHDAVRAQVWTGAWAGGYSLLTAGQVALAPALSNPGDRVDLYVGAVSTAGAAAFLLVSPLSVMADSTALDARIQAAAGQDTCTVLAEAERLLARDAANEAEGRGWLMQGANLLYNVATGLVLGIFYKRWESGALNAGVGWLIGEAMIFTQPAQLEEDLRHYQAGQIAPDRPAVTFHWGIGPNAGASGYGLRLALTF